MNKDQSEGKWRQMKGKIKQEWGDLTDDEIDEAEGRTEVLAGKIQERYGIAREDAEKRLNEMEREH